MFEASLDDRWAGIDWWSCNHPLLEPRIGNIFVEIYALPKASFFESAPQIWREKSNVKPPRIMNTPFLDQRNLEIRASILFLESPAAVGFSYTNTTSDYTQTGDKLTGN